MFDKKTSFGGFEWKMDEALEELIKSKKIEPIIAVAIYNSPNRNNEYTFSYDPKLKCGGKADDYALFIKTELYYFIKNKFKIKKERNGIIGSSLAGLFSLYSIYKYNDFFSKAGVVSPSIWWSNRKILDNLIKKPNKKVKIWMDIGTKEGQKNNDILSENVKDTRAVKDIFIRSGLIPEINFHYTEIKNAEHNEFYWSKRVKDILIYLYGK